MSCDPLRTADNIQRYLQEQPGIKVFNPNADNAFLMAGDAESANAIWLRNWREIGLTNAQKTGGWCAATARIAPSTHTHALSPSMARRPCGRCIQVITHGGLSEMQKAEADMARDKGVPVIKLHLDGKVEPDVLLPDCMPSPLKALSPQPWRRGRRR